MWKTADRMTLCTDFHVSLCLLFTHTAAKVGELEDKIQEVYQHSKDNRKETGRLEGNTLPPGLFAAPRLLLRCPQAHRSHRRQLTTVCNNLFH